MSWYNPIVVDNNDKGERSLDLASNLLNERIVFLFDEINDQSARIITAQLMILESKGSEPVRLYINSPGGSVYSALSILDTMEHMTAPVETIGIGCCASAAALILICGKKRSMTANSRVMIHQPLGRTGGQATEIGIYYEEINKLKAQINNMIVLRSSLSYQQVDSMTERDKYLSAHECLSYGFIDNVIGKSVPTTPIIDKER